ncbi:nuclease-related domain-containing protein [Acholeplasma hippikon]|uniref:Nuclease-related domain n=1 Tax=Acholeplasma hippikon TaxID=264636 RepID=A0A449BLA4_9MOLU|nr:nuclease-related domain-containing protein [Acholeplasma hippikon]VEU83157.1 Nuclease-related domain [Acholeplasma hippikon]
MAKKKKKNNGELLYETISVIIVFIVTLTIKTISIIYDAITIYTSGYKQKSQKGFFKTYFDKGNYGEFKLYKKAVRQFGKPNVLTNIYLSHTTTDTTEIDVLAISKEGIYVFEMKNYNGYIFGSKNDENWTQVFHKNAKHKFYNPLRQNYAHTKALQNYLEIDDSKVIPVVVFSNYAKLSKINITDKEQVIQLKNLNRLIRKTRKVKTNVLSLEEKESYLKKLIERSCMPDEVKQKHIEQVNDLKIQK